MKNGTMNTSKKPLGGFKKNTYEAANEAPASSSMISDFKKLGAGAFDQFFGGSQSADYVPGSESSWGFETQNKPTQKSRREFSLFNYNEYYEKELIKKEIKALTEQIKREIDILKKADASLLNDIKDIQNMSLNEMSEKPGIYHVRFLEVVLRILRTLREKVGESRTWLQAMTSKRKKRGSLFANLSKKKGTQYSLSQELQASRSIQ